MTDFALVAAGVMAAASQPASDVSTLNTSELQTQEDELIAAVLRAPVESVRVQPIQPTQSLRPVAAHPRFSSSPDVSATAEQTHRESLHRAQVEARLRRLENSALAQMPGAVISFELPSVTAQPTLQPTLQPAVRPAVSPGSTPRPASVQPIAPQLIPPQPVPSQPIAPIQRAPQQLTPRSRQAFAPPPVAFAPVSSTSVRLPYRYQSGARRVGARVWNTRTSYSARW